MSERHRVFGRFLRAFRAASCAAFVLILGALWSQAAGAYPLRGSVKLAVLLCRTSDQVGAIPSVDDIRAKVVETGTGGLGDYFNAASNGLINFGGSNVGGWYTLAHTTSYYKAARRGTIESDCRSLAAQNGFRAPSPATYFTITAPYVDSNGNFGHALVAAGDSSCRGCQMDDWAHELGHALGWRHPYSNDTHYSGGGPPGDYDDQYNVMSAMNDDTSTAMSKAYGIAPPLPDAYQMDQLGWIPRSRVKTFGADGNFEEDVTLVSLGHPEIPGLSLLRIPVSSDPFSYYTVEMVAPDGYNSGIGKPRILIKKVQPIVVHPPAPGEAYYTFLYRDPDLSGHGRGTPWSNFELTAPGVSMSIHLVTLTAHHAVVHVIDHAQGAATDVAGPNSCSEGYVWRQADDNDYVCVSRAVRDRTLAENDAPQANHSGIRCVGGYVYRDAYPGDHICVTGEERAETYADNAAANGRLAQPNMAGALGSE